MDRALKARLEARFATILHGEVRQRHDQTEFRIGAESITDVLRALHDEPEPDFAVLADKDFGHAFQGAVAYNALTGSGPTTTTAPWFAVLAGILGHNVILSAVILATFAAWIWFLPRSWFAFLQRLADNPRFTPFPPA